MSTPEKLARLDDIDFGCHREFVGGDNSTMNGSNSKGEVMIPAAEVYAIEGWLSKELRAAWEREKIYREALENIAEACKSVVYHDECLVVIKHDEHEAREALERAREVGK